MDKFEAALSFNKEGCLFLPLIHQDKRPIAGHSYLNASSNPAAAEQWFKHEGFNLGIVPSLDIIVIDVDPKNGGDEAFKRLERDLGALPPTVEVVTGSGGFHRYYKLPTDDVGRLKMKLSKYPGIDFKGCNGHLVGPGSVHPNGKYYSFREGCAVGQRPIENLPENLFELLSNKAERAVSSETSVSRDVSGNRPKADGALAGCSWLDSFKSAPKSVSEPQWYLAGNLLAHCENGREVFHGLSKYDSGRYNAGETDAKFSASLNSGALPPLCGTIERSGYDGCQRCPFSGAINSPISLAYETAEVAALQRTHAYDTSAEGWRRLSDSNVIKPAAFNDTYRHLIKGGPHAALADSKRTRKVDRTAYMPGETRLIVLDGGLPICNSWRDTGCGTSPGKHDVFDAHLAYLFPEPAELNHALDCLAHLVQHPGRKIKHAWLMIGGQGTGKSFVERLCTSLFGKENVRKSDASSLTGNFRAKLTNIQVLLLGEMMLQDRVEAYNATKELISEETIQVEEKYVKAYEALTPRLIVTSSNHLRPINVEADDRRWFIVHGPIDKKSREYYDNLYDVAFPIEIEAFKHTLLIRKLDGFSANAAPPTTTAKGRIVLESKSSLAQSFIEWIDDASAPFEKDLVSSEDIASKLAMSALMRGRLAINGAMTTHKVKAALVAAGAIQFSDGHAVLLAGGTKKRLWIVRNHEHWLAQPNEAARAHLSASANINRAA